MHQLSKREDKMALIFLSDYFRGGVRVSLGDLSLELELEQQKIVKE